MGNTVPSNESHLPPPLPTPLFYPKWEAGKFRLLGAGLVAFVEEYKPRRNRISVTSLLELGGMMSLGLVAVRRASYSPMLRARECESLGRLE